MAPKQISPVYRDSGQQLLDDAEVALIVRTHGGLGAFAQLSDVALQLRVVPLQPAHLLQVAGQPVIQELHGLLLMAVEEAFAKGPADSDVAGNVAGARQGAGGVAAVGQTEAGSTQRGCAHSDSVRVCQGGREAQKGSTDLCPKLVSSVSGGDTDVPCSRSVGAAQRVP
uniref:Uncharacterized protein n=1 Tax=Ovis aries TaxID=9940 RepID=A0AC11AZZ6_SHEEP